MGELTDQALGGVGHPDPLQHLVDRAPGFFTRMQPACRQPDVFTHRKSIENAGHLGLDADAQPRNVVGVRVRNVLAAEQHLAMGRLQLPGQHLEEGALARAVRADQAAQFSFGQREVDMAYGANAAEMHAEILGLK